MPNTPKQLYQYVDKDDTYELVGDCIGAGTDRGHDTKIYRNIHTGQLFSRLPDDFEVRMKRIGELVEFQHDDTDLLREALALFEYVTWHDGRYRQESNAEFQRSAQKLVTQLAERLEVEPYLPQKPGAVD